MPCSHDAHHRLRPCLQPRLPQLPACQRSPRTQLRWWLSRVQTRRASAPVPVQQQHPPGQDQVPLIHYHLAHRHRAACGAREGLAALSGSKGRTAKYSSLFIQLSSERPSLVLRGGAPALHAGRPLGPRHLLLLQPLHPGAVALRRAKRVTQCVQSAERSCTGPFSTGPLVQPSRLPTYLHSPLPERFHQAVAALAHRQDVGWSDAPFRIQPCMARTHDT